MLVKTAIPHIEILLNRKLKDSITAREFCKTLSGKVLEIDIATVPERILIAPIGETIEVLDDEHLKADVIFSGSIQHFMQATQSKPLELVRAGKLKMKGDMVLAGQFQRLLELARPDWQEEIAKMFGDYVGPQISSFIKGVMAFGQSVMADISQRTEDFAQKDVQVAPSREEYDDFASEVKDLQKELDDLDQIHE